MELQLFPRQVFLTKEIDLTYTFDANLRITAVTDAIGQVTTLESTLGADSSKITKVTDPSVGSRRLTTRRSAVSGN